MTETVEYWTPARFLHQREHQEARYEAWKAGEMPHIDLVCAPDRIVDCDCCGRRIIEDLMLAPSDMQVPVMHGYALCDRCFEETKSYEGGVE